MLEKLTSAWRARRVLLLGGPDAQNLYTEALLLALGARPARIPPGAKAETLCRALSSGRIGAVVVPSAHALADPDDLFAQLRALELLLAETRESGAPLVILCSHEDVYAPSPSVWQADESAPLGGRTRAGLYQSILQLYAGGFSRGLLGDAVSVVVCRHAPCLGSGHPSAAQYGAWCRALLAGEAPTVEHPGVQGTFLHPLDAACAALCLGARYYAGEADCTGAFNLGVLPENLCANRSACLRLTAQEGGNRAIREMQPPHDAPHTPLDGSLLHRLCGFRPLLNAQEALSFLMEYERAAAVGDSAADLLRQRQAQLYLEKMR